MIRNVFYFKVVPPEPELWLHTLCGDIFKLNGPELGIHSDSPFCLPISRCFFNAAKVRIYFIYPNIRGLFSLKSFILNPNIPIGEHSFFRVKQ